MPLSAWLHFFDSVPAATRERIAQALAQAGIAPAAGGDRCAPHGLAVLTDACGATLAQLRLLSSQATVLAIAAGPAPLPSAAGWSLLAAGAADVLRWPDGNVQLEQVTARLARWEAVRTLADTQKVASILVGASTAWRALVRSVVEIAAFTDSPVLITGETGTGKDLIAQAIHRLDRRGGQFTVLDCSTLSLELGGSELFGHERGAFTSAAAARDGALAQANGGVLFLDEVGELPLPLQAQLLRAVQERSYKPIGSNHWQRTEFRLLCATNRDLEQEVLRGRFRADLFYRIAAWRCRTPPLRERREDVLPLAAHFLARLAAPAAAPELDPGVRDYLLARDYPGNVRELRQLVTRAWHRHVGHGPITLGDVPPDERPPGCEPASWPDPGFEAAIGQAIALGVPLARITQAAGDLAIQQVLAQEDDNNQRAAARLGVTDRALQIRRKGWARP